MESAFDVVALSIGVITCLIGTLAFCLSSRLLQKLFAIDVAGTGVIALFVLIAARTGVATPVLSQAEEVGRNFSDPFPQAVILTAIVIGFSLEAISLALLSQMAKQHPLLRIEDFEAETSR